MNLPNVTASKWHHQYLNPVPAPKPMYVMFPVYKNLHCSWGVEVPGGDKWNRWLVAKAGTAWPLC